MLFHHLLLLLLLKVDEALALKLPTFTATTIKGARPKEIGIVKAQTGDSIVDQDLGCAGKKWQLWTTTRDTTNGQPVLKDKDVVVGCNHDQTFSGKLAGATGTSCQTAVSCTDGKCNDVTAGTSKPIYIFLDPHCFVDAQAGNMLRSRWGNYERSIRELRNKNPQGATVTTDDIYVAMPNKKDQNTGIAVSSKKFLANMWMAGPLAPGNRGTAIACKDGCRYGTHIQIGYKQKEKSMHVFLQPHCDWITVCTAWKPTDGTCGWQMMVNVMLRAGFVSFDSRKEQLPTRLLRRPKDNKGVVRVDLSVLSSETVGGPYAQLAVTTMFRQRVLGDITLGDYMLLSFSHPDCLDPDFGLRAQTGEVNVLTLTSDSKTYIDEVTNQNKNNLELDAANDPQTNEAKGSTVPDPVTPAMMTTVSDVTAAATTTVTPSPPSSAEHISPNAANPDDALADNEGHATWAVFYGWLIGSFAAMLVMGPIMYFCRRSLYADWYRGMYKRYGCDASGTTGGITQTSFGDTTTAASAMQTVDSTTASTTSTTKSQSTTASGISTMGASTVGDSAMSVAETTGAPTVTM